MCKSSLYVTHRIPQGCFRHELKSVLWDHNETPTEFRMNLFRSITFLIGWKPVPHPFKGWCPCISQLSNCMGGLPSFVSDFYSVFTQFKSMSQDIYLVKCHSDIKLFTGVFFYCSVFYFKYFCFMHLVLFIKVVLEAIWLCTVLMNN